MNFVYFASVKYSKIQICIFIKTKFLKELLQKHNDNYFGFEILYHLNKKITSKTVAEKNCLYLYLFCALLKKLKAS